MEISKNAIELIKKFEGFIKTPYFCPAHKLTIGYGHLISAGEKFPKKGISLGEAEELLKDDALIARNAVMRMVRVTLSQNQFDALVSFVYNIGEGNFEKSTMLRLINAGDIKNAAEEFTRWIYAGGKIQNGLLKRRRAERDLFMLP